MTEQQRHIPFGRPAIGPKEKDAVLSVMDGHILTHGPKCKEFEKKFSEYVGESCNAVTVSSCMAALTLAVDFFDFGPGDEVIVPAQTHVATVHAVELSGALPIFVDCDKQTGNMDLGKLELAITDKTVGIVLVHFAGISVEMDKLMEIANKHDLKVIEDCALAVGTRFKGKHVGLWGHVGCFSFYPVKHITTGEGGMLISQYPDVVEKISKYRAFGVDRTHCERKVPGLYDVKGLGTNSRMSEIQAAIGSCQVDRLPEIVNVRINNFNRLKAELLKKKLPLSILDCHSTEGVTSYYCLVTVLDKKIANKRNSIILELRKRGVETSIYYPQPVPEMTYYYEKYKIPKDQYSNAAMISHQGIAFPVGLHVTEEDISYIAKTYNEVIAEIVG